MPGKDYLNHSYAGYDKQLKLIVDAVEENAKPGGLWPHIPAENKAALKAAYNDYHPYHVAAESP
jgi:hypothetical protein